ncbi:MAG: ABC transporter ATP-binding protein [Planctomycetes bacterium]|nr:ABC transporter ATP-binding protein [Planctomycetota bacterium]
MEALAIEPLASLENITFQYPEGPETVPAIEEVSLEIPSGDFLGLIGPNGGGKTTLIKILLGLLKPQKGRVRVLGRSPREVSRFIGYVPQRGQVDPHIPATVLDVVLTGRIGLAPWGFSYRKKHLEAAESVMELVGIHGLKDHSLDQLSGGQRQRVLIARALASEVKILFLDEPMAGVDIHMEKGILDILHSLNEQMPIVLVSHDLGFISTHVKRVACLNRRLVIHLPGEVSKETISAMYHNQGDVLQIDHHPGCPIDHEAGKKTPEDR